MDFLKQNLGLLTGLVVTGVGIWTLLPKRSSLPRSVGLILTLAGLGIFGWKVLGPTSVIAEDAMFYVLGGTAVLAGLLMISSKDAVYAALWFALTTLCLCGLFLLLSAPLLAAATIIVYAGAIVVTFLFVIMLAQQSGNVPYDRMTGEPIRATLAGVLLLGTLLSGIGIVGQPSTAQGTAPSAKKETGKTSSTTAPAAGSESSQPDNFSAPLPGEGLDSVRGLGRALFTDYLFAVELAGTLLLIASIGAIAIAPRRSNRQF